MHQTLPNTSILQSDPSPPRSNRFSYEPTISHHDPSYSRSRSIEFSPTSLKKSLITSSDPHQRSSLDPRDPRRRFQKAGPSRSPPKIQRHHIDYAPKRFSNKGEEDDDFHQVEPHFEARRTKIDLNQDADSVTRSKLHQADHQKSPPKTQRHHVDYAPKRFSDKIQEEDSWKKVESHFEEKISEIGTNQDADSVSTNSSSDKSAGQSQFHIELSASNSGISFPFVLLIDSLEDNRDPRKDPRRDPRLMKKEQRGCQQQIQRKMEVEIKAIFGEKEDDEEPIITFSQKKDQESLVIPSKIQQDEEPPVISPKTQQEELPIISSKKKDEEPPIISSEKEDEEPVFIPSKMKDEEVPKKVPILIDIEEDDEQEEEEQGTNEGKLDIPEQLTNIEMEEPEEEEQERIDKDLEIPIQTPNIEVEEEDDDNETLELSPPKILLYESIGTIDPRKRLQKPTTIFINKKLNLVLDLDETLINSHTVSQDFDLKQIKNIPQDSLSIMKNGELKTIIVVRPYYQEFLERMSKHYNLFLYSHGRYDYVQFALEIIDKNKQFISREKIFKNQGQVCRGTSKRLENLGFTQEEINKTMILDDQRQIWEHEHPQVICSKKFIPLKDFIKEEKYSRYLLFKAKQYSKNWLSGQENQSELEFYCETHASYSQQRLGQLEILAHFFEEIAKDHEKTVVSSPEIKIQEICEARMRSILKSIKIGIMSNCGARKKMFENVAEILGATVMEEEKAHYLIVDHDVKDEEKTSIKNLMEEKPMIVVVTVGWLMECFFRLTKVSVNNFLRKF